jgi:hypothetical protein
MDEERATAAGLEEASLARARLRGRRAALGVVFAAAILFIGSSAWQIVHALFAESRDGVLVSPEQRACAMGLRDLATALDRAASLVVASSYEVGTNEAVAAFRRGLSPEWNTAVSVERTCATSPEGAEAWAALERLRSAEEQLTRQSRAELGPIRRDLTAHLPSDLR